jgi:hypothetical protein
MVVLCIECGLLWQEYSDEKKAYLKILKQIEEATICWSPEVLVELEKPRSEASKRCAAAWQTFNAHKRETHGKIARSNDSPA